MLVLSRKSGQSLYIGDDIQVRVISISGKRVKIGIEAPSGCRILRAELTETARAPETNEAAGEEQPDIVAV